MDSYRQHSLEAPVSIGFEPNHGRAGVPYEVLDRSTVLAKKTASDYRVRQRPGFHQLVVCTSGEGTHVVDFEAVSLRRGTVLRIHPGQVQRFVPDQPFEATMMVWPTESHRKDPNRTGWFPGSNTPTKWNVDDELLARVLRWLDDLRTEQPRFDGSTASKELLLTLMHSLLLRLATELPTTEPAPTELPQPYIDLRMAMEKNPYDRPTVSSLASHLGYSSRTLDRACDFAVGKTAKQVLDERVALEVRRLLTHTDRSVASVGAEFGFTDASNFSKFVRRHLGQRPTAIRATRELADVPRM